ncbi:KamA family radical SAM protein [Streptomyces olivochromogenes]|uniref:KamA family radical SAM protein n=1 Tax=Streptomyces olivochromogenes TaxID=1963 RepID=UPI0036DCDD94
MGRIRRHENTRRIQVTPYYLSLIQRTVDGSAPLANDPLWRQVAPTWSEGEDGAFSYVYDGVSENWELPHEMVTPIAQHKYDNRVIIRYGNVCHAYCQFCFEALRTLERNSRKSGPNARYWAETIDYLARHTEVEEVILSGGEPLLHGDDQVRLVLADLAGLNRPLAVRIHTRALTFNPFRITKEMADVLRGGHVTAVGLHVSHPRELTDDFWAAVRRLREAVPILFANMPLLRGINDDVATLRELCMRLYLGGVSAGYLYHFMPFSPGGESYGTSVWRGVELVGQLKRRVSNIAVPEYVLPHSTGKFTMPLTGPDDLGPKSVMDDHGNRTLRFTNWRGETVVYPDVYGDS